MYANFVDKYSGDRWCSVLEQHPEMSHESPTGMGYSFRYTNSIGDSWDENHHLIEQCGTSDAKNVDDYISRDNLFANANSTRKPLLLSCSAPSHPHHLLLGFTVIMWPGRSSLAETKWHCFTLKRMRFLREDEDFNPAFWNHNGTSEYDQIPLEHRKLFYNWNRVKSKEDDWVYSNTREQQDLLNNLNNELA